MKESTSIIIITYDYMNISTEEAYGEGEKIRMGKIPILMLFQLKWFSYFDLQTNDNTYDLFIEVLPVIASASSIVGLFQHITHSKLSCVLFSHTSMTWCDVQLYMLEHKFMMYYMYASHDFSSFSFLFF